MPVLAITVTEIMGQATSPGFRPQELGINRVAYSQEIVLGKCSSRSQGLESRHGLERVLSGP